MYESVGNVVMQVRHVHECVEAEGIFPLVEVRTHAGSG